MSLTVKGYAKINLWLDITGRTENNYHTLSSVMRRIDLYDEVGVSVSPGKGITLSCDVPGFPVNEQNTAYKAAALFLEKLGKEDTAVRISIKKHIPSQAGLGGSSADAAAVLSALDTLLGTELKKDELMRIGAKVGADVPFCLSGGTAICTGIADIIRPVNCSPFAVLVIKPRESFSTALAYARYDEGPIPENGGFKEFCASLDRDVSYFAGNMYNVFEELYNSAEIQNIRDSLLSAGALGARMTGSGSAVFGIFEDIVSAQKAMEKLSYNEIYAVKAL